MTTYEIAYLSMVIGAMGLFGLVLFWASRHAG